jgi:hypothetical protein
VIAVFEDRVDPKPTYIMWLEWGDGRISFIRDYRYVTADARADAGAGGKSRGRRRCSVTCGAEYAAGAEFRLASRSVTSIGDTQITERRRFALGPVLLRPCAASRRLVRRQRGALNLILAVGE